MALTMIDKLSSSSSSSSCEVVVEGILLSLDQSSSSHKNTNKSVVNDHVMPPAPFLTKTYDLVNDPTTDHIVSWGEHHTTFVVWRPPEFARHLLPNYFKHNNFSSFVRQLNTYGFRKIVPDRWEFANDYFKKGEKHLLCEISRRKTSSQQHHFTEICGAGGGANGFFSNYSSRSDSISPPNSDVDHLCCDSSPSSLTSPTTTAAAGIFGIFKNNINRGNKSTSVMALSEDNERLRRSNNMLMSELAHMRKLYNDVMYFLQNQHHVNYKKLPMSNYHCSSYPSTTTSSPHLLLPPAVSPIYGLMSSFSSSAGSNNTANATVVYASKLRNQQQQLQFHDKYDDEIINNNNMNNAAGTSRTKKLFGVPLIMLSKKRLHPDHHHQYYNYNTNNKTSRLMINQLEKVDDDLGLKLMPPPTSPCT